MSAFTGHLGALGALLGLLAGVGLALVARGLPLRRTPSFDERIAPYLRDAMPPSRLLDTTSTRSPFPVVQRIAGPLVTDLAERVGRLLGGTASVRRRLHRSGSDRTVEQFRIEQVVWGGIGLLAGAVVSLLLLASGLGRQVVPLLVLTGLAAVCGVLGRDQVLTQQVKRREARIVEEFPAIAELFALAVAAGESPVAALERLSRAGQGILPSELNRTVAAVRAGAPITQALQDLADRAGVAAVSRFVDGVVIAIERGTPLADVLRDQAVDVRAARQRALIETAGRREIGMMVPVVFLILPLTVLFALFPGFIGLSLFVP
ncbi:MAG TPA: type II secretion system F family protein [Streptosporangiales bacterium]